MCIGNKEDFNTPKEKVIHTFRDVTRNTTQSHADRVWNHLVDIFNETDAIHNPAIQDILSDYIIQLQQKKDPDKGYSIINLSRDPDGTADTLKKLRARINDAYNDGGNRNQLSNDIRNLAKQMLIAEIQNDKFNNIPGIAPISQLQNNNSCNLIYKPKCPVKKDYDNAFCTSSGWMCPIMWTQENQLPPANNGPI
jgi:hypothetical protein